MDGDLNSINLFRGYTQEENAHTHAFLAFLNYLLQSDKTLFRKYWRALGLGANLVTSKDITISCLKQDYGGTWDGQVFSEADMWFVAIESKIKKAAISSDQFTQHTSHVKLLKKQFKIAKLLLLTPFDKEWLIKEYFDGKKNKHLDFLSWGDVYKATADIGVANNCFVVRQYRQYLEAANRNRSGIIQIVSSEYIDEDYISRVKRKKTTKFHIPSKKMGFDVPNFRVFIYDRHKGGIFSFFTSRGMYLNPEYRYRKSFKYYFEIEGFRELHTPITDDDIRRLLGGKEMGGNFRHFKKSSCPAPYYVLNAAMVSALESEANSR